MGSSESIQVREPLISVRNLRKAFKDKSALQEISFDILPGTINALIGPNGSGKTTTLKALTGQIAFDGDVRVCGLNATRNRVELMREVAYVADVAVLPRWATASQLIDFMQGVHPRFSKDKALALLKKTQVSPSSMVRTLSKGMVVQLHLSLAMAIDARVLILDEPTLGLDPLFRKEFYRQLLEDFFDHERTIIVSTHQIEEIEHVVSDVLFIKDGRLVLQDSMEGLSQRFQAVWVDAKSVEKAESLGPIEKRKVMGKSVMLFEGRSSNELAELGEIQAPSLTDVFTSKMHEVAA